MPPAHGTEGLRPANKARPMNCVTPMKVAVLAGHVDLASRLGPGGEGLSGGQRRRLGVARPTCATPRCATLFTWHPKAGRPVSSRSDGLLRDVMRVA